MKFLIPTIILTIVTAFVLWIMLRNWMRRKRRDASLLHDTTTFTGELIEGFERALYVATTPTSQVLERVAPPGLGFRGYANLDVLTDGVRVQVAGEPEVRLPKHSVTGTHLAQMTIDRVVERDGLVALDWRAADEAATAHQSMFRFLNAPDQVRFMQGVERMLATEPSSSHDPQPTPQETK